MLRRNKGGGSATQRKSELVSEQGRMRGVVLGTAVGDSVGLAAEGISRRRIGKLFPHPWQHHFLFGHGMLSDDSEHTTFVIQALLRHPDSPAQFARRLAWSLRWWFASLPAGIGLATGRAIIKLWLGFSPQRSGVYSAGNGPAMRAAPIGACYWREPEVLARYVAASTRLTHSDPRAQVGAQAVASLCAWCFQRNSMQRPSAHELIRRLRDCGTDDREWQELIDGMANALQEGCNVQQYAASLGQENGVSGYVYRTVPVAVYAWYQHFGGFEETLSAVLDCGGDTDTVGAIAGALAGAAVGDEGIPPQWINGITDWPRGRRFLYRLADQLYQASQDKQTLPAVRYFWPAVIPRNVLFLAIVLLHGFRRLLPPYAK